MIVVDASAIPEAVEVVRLLAAIEEIDGEHSRPAPTDLADHTLRCYRQVFLWQQV